MPLGGFREAPTSPSLRLRGRIRPRRAGRCWRKTPLTSASTGEAILRPFVRDLLVVIMTATQWLHCNADDADALALLLASPSGRQCRCEPVITVSLPRYHLCAFCQPSAAIGKDSAHHMGTEGCPHEASGRPARNRPLLVPGKTRMNLQLLPHSTGYLILGSWRFQVGHHQLAAGARRKVCARVSPELLIWILAGTLQGAREGAVRGSVPHVADGRCQL